MTHAKKIDPRKCFGPTQNILTHVKSHAKVYLTHATHAKKFDPRNPRKMLTHVKNILTHVTHATQVKI